MFRTRFKKEIVAEFLPPARLRKKQRVILLCDGMPSMPRKQPLAQFLAQKGYWVFYPRWRGAWESGGQLLEHPPQQDLSDIIDELPKGVREIAFGKKFKLSPEEIFVIGGSFGGAAALLSSLDPRVTKVIANCPVVHKDPHLPRQRRSLHSMEKREQFCRCRGNQTSAVGSRRAPEHGSHRPKVLAPDQTLFRINTGSYNIIRRKLIGASWTCT